MLIGGQTLTRAEIELRGPWDGELPPVSIDTRTVEEGGLFWALPGSHTDGHLFVREAFQRGAKIAAVSREWANTHAEETKGRTLFVMENTLVGLLHLAAEVRATLGAVVVGLTGSNGKTTTREMLAAALATAGETARNPGNYNNHIGVPLTLLNLGGSERFLVIEMGANHVGEIAGLCAVVRPGIGLITNIAEAHLGEFGGIEKVQRAKKELFDFLEEEGGLAVVNLEDERVVQAAGSVRRKVGYTLGAVPAGWKHAVYSGEIVGSGPWGRPVLAVEGMRVTLSLPGLHWAPAALGAFAAAVEAGAEADRALEAVAAVEALPGRGRLLDLPGDVQLLDDSYNANVPSIGAALEALARHEGPRVAILGDVLELGEYEEEEHRRLGRLEVLADVDRIWFIGRRMNWAAEEAEFLGHSGVERVAADEVDALAGRIAETLPRGAGILVKGSRAMGLERVVEGLRNLLQAGGSAP